MWLSAPSHYLTYLTNEPVHFKGGLSWNSMDLLCIFREAGGGRFMRDSLAACNFHVNKISCVLEEDVKEGPQCKAIHSKLNARFYLIIIHSSIQQHCGRAQCRERFKNLSCKKNIHLRFIFHDFIFMQQICDCDSFIYLCVYTIYAPTVLVNPGQV